MPAALPIQTVEKAKHLLATGLNQTETAKELGIDRTTSHRIAKKHQKDIEKLALDIVTKSVKPIRETHLQTLRLATELIDLTAHCNSKTKYHRLKGLSNLLAMSGLSAKDILTISDKKEYRALQIMGIAPSHTASLVINQLFNVDSVNVVDPGIQEVLGGHLANILDDSNVIDADFTDDMSNQAHDS